MAAYYLVLSVVLLLVAQRLSATQLEDKTAYTDRLFTYQLPSHQDYTEVRDLGSDSLPQWMSFDTRAGTLQGVPSEKDTGTYILSADGDLFAVTITHNPLLEIAEPAHSDNKPTTCKPQDSVTEVKVILNSDIKTLDGKSKSKMLEDFSRHLSLHNNQVALRSQKLGDLADLAQALVSGLGDKKKKDPSKLTSLFTWIVGCGTVSSHQMSVLEKLETSAKDGTLSRALRHSVSNWHVSITKPSSPSKRRLKRQVGVTLTPKPTEPTDIIDTTTPSSSVVTPTSTVPGAEPTKPTTFKESTTLSPTEPETIPTTIPTTAIPTTAEPTTTVPTTTMPTTTVPTTTVPTTTPTTTPTTPSPIPSTPEPTTQSTTTLSEIIATSAILPASPTTEQPTTQPPTTTSPTTPVPAQVTTEFPLLPDPATTEEIVAPKSRATRSTTESEPDTTPSFITIPPSPPPTPIFTTLLSTTTVSEGTSEHSTKEKIITRPVTTTGRVTMSLIASTTQMPTSPPPITPPPPPFNRAPVLNSDVQTPILLSMTAGKMYDYPIPQDLFTDADGDRIEYSVHEYSTSKDINTGSGTWLMFDKVNNYLIGMPLTDHVGTSKYILRATDIKGAFTDVHLTAKVASLENEVVSQFYLLRFSHPFTATQRHMLDLVYTLRATLQLRTGRENHDIVIHEVYKQGDGMSRSDDPVVKLSISGPEAITDCPTRDNSEDLEWLRSFQGQQMPLQIYIDLHSVPWHSVRSLPLSPCENLPPVVNEDVASSFSLIVGVKGQLLNASVPLELFIDQEDFDLEYMELDLLMLDIELKGESWVKFDKVTKTIRGLPWDIEPPKTYQYTLKCTDSMGKTAEHDIELQITSPPFTYSEPTNEMGLVIDEKYSLFANSISKQLAVVDGLNEAFSGVGAPVLSILDIKPGSVVINFTLHDRNNAEDCDIVQRYGDEVANGNFMMRLESYNVKELSFTPQGSCSHLESAVYTPRKGPGKIINGHGFKLMYIIIPVAIVCVLVIIVIVVVCCIKCRKKKSHDVSKSNGHGKYIETGVPVVFEEEMKDIKTEPTESEPLMEENCNTPKPPAYPHNGTSSPEAVPFNTNNHNNTGGYPPTPPVSEPDEQR